MIYLLTWWRELIIVLLVIACGVLGLRLQSATHEAKEMQLVHEKIVAESKQKSAELISQVNEQRKIDAEQYANEINIINSKYDDALSRSNRVQQQITTYNARLDTVSRKALENYAKTASTVFRECTSEYLKLGQYTAKLDAELDSKTKAP